MRVIIRAALVLTMILVAGPLYADLQCDTYYDDSRAYDDGYDDFCWLSGSICVNCYDVGTPDSCTEDLGPCDPYPQGPDIQVAQLFERQAMPVSPCMAKALHPKDDARLIARIL